MKKDFAYSAIATVAAVLLAAGLMFSTFWALPAQMKTDSYAKPLSPATVSAENLRGLSAESERSSGVIPNHPMDAMAVGLMLTFSLILALFVSAAAKKRAI